MFIFYSTYNYDSGYEILKYINNTCSKFNRLCIHFILIILLAHNFQSMYKISIKICFKV